MVGVWFQRRGCELSKSSADRQDLLSFRSPYQRRPGYQVLMDLGLMRGDMRFTGLRGRLYF